MIGSLPIAPGSRDAARRALDAIQALLAGAEPHDDMTVLTLRATPAIVPAADGRPARPLAGVV